ncbi:hypothetical protein FQR65_LT08228 [Abscondita terminalis]|nr:hypothetical protein FQR65_LT08228 [Abscondita terminalis]
MTIKKVVFNIKTNIFSLEILHKFYYLFQFTSEFALLIWTIFVTILQCSFKKFRIPLEKSVEGDVVLIIGSGHGIGKELALQYADLGATVVCVDINSNTNKNTVTEIKKKGKVAFGYQCDVTKRNKVFQTIEKIQKEVGEISILINSAGFLNCQAIVDCKGEEIQKTIDVNLMSHFWVLQSVLPTMLKNNRGHVVAVSSSQALTGAGNLIPYSSCQFAVRGLMESIRREISENGDKKIQFTTILPCVVDTRLHKNYSTKVPSLTKITSPSEAAAAIISAQKRDEIETSIPYQYLTISSLTKLLPVKAETLWHDFMGVRYEPDTEK